MECAVIRMLLLQDDVSAAERLLAALGRAGLDCACERVATEAAFRAALARDPDLILADAETRKLGGLAALDLAHAQRPQTPIVILAKQVREEDASRALLSGAHGYAARTDVERIVMLVREIVQPATARFAPRAEEANGGSVQGAMDASRTAAYLLQRRATLDRALRAEDRSAMSRIIRRRPPIPLALVIIEHEPVRTRFMQLLRIASIDVEEAADSQAALASLAARVHALMLTDQLELVRDARQLEAGAATHIIFIDRQGAIGSERALRAGANDYLPEEPRGAEFWTRLTTAHRIVSLAASLQLALRDNRILSTIDDLTRCAGRRFFDNEFPREVERSVRLHRPLGLIMCDIDHFKQVNDRHGHQTGDEVLREFAERLGQGLRWGEDWVARVGGEEFAVVLPDVAEHEARAIAERLRERIDAARFHSTAGPLHVTASFGVAVMERAGLEAERVDRALVESADAALYRSKREGRNRVTAVTLRPGRERAAARPRKRRGARAARLAPGEPVHPPGGGDA